MSESHVPLRDYIDQRMDERHANDLERIRALESKIAALEKLLDARLAGMQVAVDKQEAAYNERFEKVNEFRASLSDLANRQVAYSIFAAYKETTDARFSAHNTRLSALESWRNAVDGRIIGWSGGVGFVVLVISIIVVFLNT